jgi:DnaJ-class molecular chaperone
MKRIHTHYDNLKVARNAPPEVIRAAYKTLSQKYHPDRNPDNPEAERIMKIINVSYEILSDPDKRKKHDVWILEQEEGYLDANKGPGVQDKSTIEFSPPVAGVFFFYYFPRQPR